MPLLSKHRPVRAALAAGALAVALFLGLHEAGGAAPAAGVDGAAARPTAHTSQPYLYLKTRGTYRNTTVYGGRSWSVYQPEQVERWIAADGSGRQRTVSLAPRFVSAADREAWEEAGKPGDLGRGSGERIGDETFKPGAFDQVLETTTMLSTMPTEVDDLSRWLEARVEDPDRGGVGNGFSVAVKTIELAGELLGNPLASPAQRAALVKAEAKVPDVEDLGDARDELGHRGVAIGARSGNSGIDSVYSLIIDPDTSQLLASETRMVSPPAGDEGLFSTTTYLVEGEVRSRFKRPHRTR